MAWIVRGKRYDLSRFKHPGGPVALSLAKGRDADELIRSYHPFNEEKVRAILEKFEVKDAQPVPNDAVFETTESTFDLELKSLAKEYFRGRPRTADTRRWIEYLCMLLLCIGSLYFFMHGYYFSLVTTPIFFWVFGVNTFHDASHFAVSRHWIVNAAITYLHPWFSSPTTWYYQHVLGHHPFVNIRGKDPDLYHHSALHRYMPWHRFRPLHAFQTWSIWVVWSIGTWVQSLLTDFMFIRRGVYQHVVPITSRMPSWRTALHFVGRALTILLFIMWPFYVMPFGKAVLWSTIPWFLFSFLYLSISQVGHIVDEALSTATDRDFYKHQILHTHNYATSSWLSFYVSGGLNLQIEHHLFPGVNHCHLRRLAPLVKSLCHKYGISYNESSSYFEAVAKHFSHLRALTAPVASAVVAATTGSAPSK